MNVYHLWRSEDVTGVSGVGLVAEIMEFSDGKCAMRWMASNPRSVAVYDSLADLVAIHGHNGATVPLQVRQVPCENCERCDEHECRLDGEVYGPYWEQV